LKVGYEGSTVFEIERLDGGNFGVAGCDNAAPGAGYKSKWG